MFVRVLHSVALGDNFKSMEVILALGIKVNLQQDSAVVVDAFDISNPGLMDVGLAHKLGNTLHVVFVQGQGGQVSIIVLAATFVLVSGNAFLSELEFLGGRRSERNEDGRNEGNGREAVHDCLMAEL